VNPRETSIQTPPDEPVIRLQRFFAGPPDLVFRAWTEPALLRRWWGPAGLTLAVCEIDLRVGGGYRFGYRAAGGAESGYGGRYLEIKPGVRLVYTATFDIWPDRECVDALDFVPVTGGTLLSVVSTHQSIEWRDAHVNGGMERGMRDNYGRLDQFLREEQS
jgi:uncharacterized protein YndB with AHSA1/START domain